MQIPTGEIRKPTGGAKVFLNICLRRENQQNSDIPVSPTHVLCLPVHHCHVLSCLNIFAQIGVQLSSFLTTFPIFETFIQSRLTTSVFHYVLVVFSLLDDINFKQGSHVHFRVLSHSPYSYGRRTSFTEIIVYQISEQC